MGAQTSGKFIKGGHRVKKVTKLRTFSVRGGGSTPFHSFWGCFPHYDGALNTTKLMTKRRIVAQSDQFNDKTPHPHPPNGKGNSRSRMEGIIIINIRRNLNI